MAVVDIEAFAREQETRKRASALAAWNLLGTRALAEPLPPIPWLCEGLGLAPGAVSLVAGYGYSRKTMALQSLALSVATGRDVWGVFRVRQGPAVHLDYEQGRRLTQERYQRLAIGMGIELAEVDESLLRVACMPRLYLDTQEAIDSLMPVVDGAALVIVDSLRAAFPHADENSSEVRSYLDALNHVSERTGATIKVIHHARKPQADGNGTATHAIRGSSALFDACQSVFVFAGEKGKPTTVHHQKDRVRGKELDDFGITAEDIPGPSGPMHGLRVVHLEAEQMAESVARMEKAKEDRLHEAAKESVLAVLRGGPFRGSQDALRSVARVRRDLVYRAISELVQGGVVVKEGSYREPIWRTR